MQVLCQHSAVFELRSYHRGGNNSYEKTCSRMIAICVLLCLLGTKVTHTAGQSYNGRECYDQKVNILSLVNPDSEIGTLKKSLDDVPSLAVLANDLRAALPKSFTICSDIMSVYSTVKSRLMFFQLLGSNGELFLRAFIMNGRDFFTTRIASGQIPQVFPNQWVRSCWAFDTVSGMIQWVVDGKLIENNTIPVLTLLKVVDIKEEDYSIELQIQITLQWKLEQHTTTSSQRRILTHFPWRR